MAETMRVECDLDGCEGQHVDFKGTGWKFKHLRAWEDAPSSSQAVKVVSERIVGWNLTASGQPVIFKDGAGAFDELDPAVARWLVSRAFLEAYNRAGQADPNGS